MSAIPDPCPVDGAGHDRLSALGASADTARQLIARVDAGGSGCCWARVSRVERAAAVAVTERGAVTVRTSEPVAVGDWCVIRAAGERTAAGSEVYDVVTVLPRRTELVRRAAGPAVLAQVLAVNVDVVLIAVPLDRDMSRRQLERLCVVARESGAEPVALLTKADVLGPVELAVAVGVAESVSLDMRAVPVSATDGSGLDALSGLTKGRTSVLVGGSGAGKSTLVNALTGARLATGDVRTVDGKGRHTTTWRELVQLPGGGALIDTPGLRELGLWIGSEGLSTAFADVTDLAQTCRFNDCGHQGEPGCAVAAALDSGALDAERLQSYRKLQREAAHVARQHDKRLAHEQLQQWKRITKEVRGRTRP